jgi:cyclase
MSSTLRIIPRLDVKGNNLVKGVHLEGLRVLGLPERFSRQYYLDGADEILFMDLVASLYNRNNLGDVIRRIVQDVYVPITVGGGIRTIDDMRRILRSGADKVALNTAVVANPELLYQGAKTFGSQCMVLSIEAIRQGPGMYRNYTDNGREPTGLDVVEWTRRAADLGAGEILLTSVDREGTGKGYDLELIDLVCSAVDIPVIACGGAGSPEDIVDVAERCDVGALAAASIFHYGLLESTGLEKCGEGNVDYLKQFLRGGRSILDNYTTASVSEVKDLLSTRGISVCGAPTTTGKNAEPCATSGVPAAAKPLVVLADYGGGNLFSVEQALRASGADILISKDPEDVRRADKALLAGVGSFGDGMRELRTRGLIEALREFIADGKDVLGICLGMQLLFEWGYEFGTHEGLGFLPGSVTRLDNTSVRIPHIGWNAIFPREEAAPFQDALMDDVDSHERFYFVHSYQVQPTDPGCCVAWTRYGDNEFCSALRKDNLAGCQFHPERSGPSGLKIYRNWITL